MDLHDVPETRDLMSSRPLHPPNSTSDSLPLSPSFSLLHLHTPAISSLPYHRLSTSASIHPISPPPFSPPSSNSPFQFSDLSTVATPSHHNNHRISTTALPILHLRPAITPVFHCNSPPVQHLRPTSVAVSQLHRRLYHYSTFLSSLHSTTIPQPTTPSLHPPLLSPPLQPSDSSHFLHQFSSHHHLHISTPPPSPVISTALHSSASRLPTIAGNTSDLATPLLPPLPCSLFSSLHPCTPYPFSFFTFLLYFYFGFRLVERR